MTVEHIKEQLSLHYLGTLASVAGFKVDRPSLDYGVDAMIERIEVAQIGDRKRYFGSGQSIDVQLKCTTQSVIQENPLELKYDLKVKNYNDLINRYQVKHQTQSAYIPLVLILMVLPDEQDQWVSIQASGKLIINARAYWYYPKTGDKLSSNKSSQRISIKKNNQLNLEFFTKVFNLII